MIGLFVLLYLFFGIAISISYTASKRSWNHVARKLDPDGEELILQVAWLMIDVIVLPVRLIQLIR